MSIKIINFLWIIFLSSQVTFANDNYPAISSKTASSVTKDTILGNFMPFVKGKVKVQDATVEEDFSKVFGKLICDNLELFYFKNHNSDTSYFFPANDTFLVQYTSIHIPAGFEFNLENEKITFNKHFSGLIAVRSYNFSDPKEKESIAINADIRKNKKLTGNGLKFSESTIFDLDRNFAHFPITPGFEIFSIQQRQIGIQQVPKKYRFKNSFGMREAPDGKSLSSHGLCGLLMGHPQSRNADYKLFSYSLEEHADVYLIPMVDPYGFIFFYYFTKTEKDNKLLENWDKMIKKHKNDFALTAISAYGPIMMWRESRGTIKDPISKNWLEKTKFSVCYNVEVVGLQWNKNYFQTSQTVSATSTKSSGVSKRGNSNSPYDIKVRCNPYEGRLYDCTSGECTLKKQD